MVKYNTYFPNGELIDTYDLSITVNDYALAKVERIKTIIEEDGKENTQVVDVLYDSTQTESIFNKELEKEIVENLMLAMIKFSIWEK
jgi:hypothetical protein